MTEIYELHSIRRSQSYPKNPHIAKFFVQMARAEELGTGIRNVYRYSKRYSDKLPQFKEEDLFEVIIPLPDEKTTSKTITKKTIKTITKKLPKTISKKTRYITGESRENTVKTITKKTSKTIIKKKSKTISKKRLQILSLIEEKPSIKAKEIGRLIRLSEAGVRYHLNNLKKDKLIQYIGSAKTGSWKITLPATSKIGEA